MIRESQQESLKKIIGCGQLSTGMGLNQEQSLQRAGDTRWGSHFKTFLKDGPSDPKKRQARGLLDHVNDFDFVFHLRFIICTSCFSS
jgi:hypothetical protein